MFIAAKVCSFALDDSTTAGSLTATVGLLDDTDAQGIISPLLAQVDDWIAVTADAPRAIEAMTLAPQIAALSNKPCLAADSIAEAMAFARTCTADGDRILATGSFYVVGPALEWIRQAT